MVGIEVETIVLSTEVMKTEASAATKIRPRRCSTASGGFAEDSFATSTGMRACLQAHRPSCKCAALYRQGFQQRAVALDRLTDMQAPLDFPHAAPAPPPA